MSPAAADERVGFIRGFLLVGFAVLVGSVVSILHGLGYGVLGLVAAFMAGLVVNVIVTGVIRRYRG